MAVAKVGYYIVAILMLKNHLARGAMCIFGGSIDCIFPCNCANNGPCDSQTGACHDRCRDGQPRPAGNETRFDWRGPGCRIGNVALHKVVNQKGEYREWYANHSVDGKLPSEESDHEATCAHTAVGGQPAWWSVDLQGNYHIYNITLFNRLDFTNARRTANFTIRVGNSSDISMNPLCLYFPGQVPYGGSVTLICTNITIGRYVSMHRIGGIGTKIINICEVVVMGYEITTADCSRCHSECNDVVGCSNCTGYRPPQCLICDAGRYGTNCMSSCSDHHCKGGYMTCDNSTGECPDGCQDWYIGGKCDTHINEVRFDASPSAEVMNSTHINVTWGPHGDISSNMAQYYGYQVQYKASNGSQLLSGPNVSHVDGVTVYSSIIGGLHHNTRYILVVSVYRKHGDLFEIPTSPKGEIGVKTPCVSPDPVTLLNLTSSDDVGTITLHVVWEATSSGCDNISFVVIWFKPNTTDEWMTLDVMNPATSNSASITDVTYGIWEVKIRATNNEDISSDSATRSVTIIDQSMMKTPPPTTIEDNQGGNSKRNSNVGIIAGPVIAGFLVETAGVAIVVFCLRRQRSTPKSTMEELDSHPCANRLSDASIDKPIGVVGPVNRTEVPAKSRTTPALHTAPGCTSSQQSPQEFNAPSDTTSEQPTTSSQPISAMVKISAPSQMGFMQSDTSAPISLDRLQARITQLSQPIPQAMKTKDGKKDITNGFEREFDDLPGIDFKFRTVGRSQANLTKNRFKNIQPFDETRVKLDATNELNGSDYINASYIVGYPKQARHYIATQGPTKDTLVAFWFMIWQQRSNRIVMLTQLFEGGKNKCEQYWPDDIKDDKRMSCGPFKVELILSEVHTDYAYRRLHLLHKGEEREIHQLHFLAWDDKKCPEDNFPLLTFRGTVSRLSCAVTGPLIVHCSAGVGRTGTYIALDYLLNQAKRESQIDVFLCVYRLRTQRMNMVQTANQYKFLYDAVLEGIETHIGETGISSALFIAQYDKKFQDRTYSNQNPLEEEYEVMCKYKPQQETSPASASNMEKNRSPDVFPVDSHRPRLSTPYSEGDDYINAVYTNGYNYRKATILTQMPLPNTVVDFWRLVYDHECHCIVMLDDISVSNGAYPEYIGDDEMGQETHGPIQVEQVGSDKSRNPNIVIRTLNVSKIRRMPSEQPRIVRHFQLLGWPSHEQVPPRPDDIIDMIDKVTEWRLQQTRGTVVVHCTDGAERSGLFAASCYMLDLLKAEQEVDVMLAARYITSRRPQAISSLAQYKFLHELAKCYLSGFHTYGNI